MSGTKIMITAVSDPKRNDANLAFVTGFLRLQSQLLATKGVSVSITFAHDVAAVIDAFKKQDDVVQLICIDTMLGFNQELVLRMIQSEHDVIVGAYPLPKLYWDDVKARLATTKETTKEATTTPVTGEDVKNAALIFNVDIDDASTADNGYASVKAVRNGEIGIFKITRRVVEETPTPFDPVSGWKGHVYTDTRHPCTSFGPVDYIGCVGHRTLIR